MKKIIVSLVVLLLFVIATCTYQKTYAIYSLQTIKSETQETPTIITNVTEKETKPSVEKEEKPSEEKQSVEKPLVPIPVKPMQIPQTVTPILPISEKPSLKVEVKQTIEKPKVIEKIEETIKVSKPEIKKVVNDEEVLKEIEVLDSLLLALMNRDIALENREQFLLEIEKLLQEALDNRFTVIANRTKDEVNQNITLKELFELRELLLNTVYQEAEETAKNTYKVGE